MWPCDVNKRCLANGAHFQLLYCISFFRTVTSKPLLYYSSNEPDIRGNITAAGYLDAAMAQITVRFNSFQAGLRSSPSTAQSIYPLIVFILVQLDKVHHSRVLKPLRNNDLPKERSFAVTVTFDIDVERSTAAPDLTSAHPIAASSGINRQTPAEDDAKLAVIEEV